MSIALMTTVWDSELPTNSHKLVLLAFADHANDDGFCWPSLSRIAERSQLSRRQVRRIVSSLKEMGLLVVLEKERQHRTPMYELREDKLTPLPGSGRTSKTLREDISASGGTNATSGRTPVTPKPSYRTVIREPSRESLEDFSFFDEWTEKTGTQHEDDPRRKDAVVSETK